MSQYYLLLENQQQGFKQLYSGKYSKPQAFNLFEQTELEGLIHQAPIVATDQGASLANLQETLQQNTGLILQTDYTTQELLNHLKWLLIVYMNAEQAAIFRYYDPIISQYFFTSLNEQEKTNWLGPIKTIQWYSNTWRNRVYESDSWQMIENQHAQIWQKEPQQYQARPALQKAQTMALQDMQEEKFAYHWQQNAQLNTANINIDQAIYWVKQGINIGLWDDADLEKYLAIRSQYPKQQLPEQWPTTQIDERIAYLTKYFNQTSTLQG